ncbi:dynein heavy chain 6, axonemal, partial [Kipferlia bialata]
EREREREIVYKLSSEQLSQQLSSEQLSQQDHYDFGMRALKAVLVMAGALKRQFSHLSEDVVLIRAMRDSNVPKFLADDISLFMGIVQDLFPGVDIPKVQHGALTEAVEETLAERGLQVVPTQVLKVVELHETTRVRHGVMLVGPSGGSKSVCHTLLSESLTKLSKRSDHETTQPVQTFTLNPKCIDMMELYGSYNEATAEWKDGLIAIIVRQMMQDESQDEKWIIFDGPVDTLWIENMNTVLDDNKTLCLANSERIKLNDTVHILFEVKDLAVASPATVSRCGMVYLDEDVVGWAPAVQTFIDKELADLSPELRSLVMNLFDQFVEEGVKYVRKHVTEHIATTSLSLAMATARHFVSCLRHNVGLKTKLRVPEGEEGEDEEDSGTKYSAVDLLSVSKYGGKDQVHGVMRSLFAWAFVWGIGGTSIANHIEEFSDFARDLFDQDQQMPSFPSKGTVFDYYVDWEPVLKQMAAIKVWKEQNAGVEEQADNLPPCDKSLVSFAPWK